MQLVAPPFFFIVKINKTQQKKTREFDGALAVSHAYKYMQHEIQYGEIVSMGTLAQELFPTVKEGHILIFHHFVTGKGIEDREDNPYLIYSDDDFNYYTVTVKSYNGDRNLTYGVWDGEKIIPHKDFIFLNSEDQKKEVVETNGLVEIKNWSESRDKKTGRMEEAKSQIMELTKTNVKAELIPEIKKRETQMNAISAEINKKQFQLYKVAYSHPSLPQFKEAGILNIACHTKVAFMDKEYLIAPIKYLAYGSA